MASIYCLVRVRWCWSFSLFWLVIFLIKITSLFFLLHLLRPSDMGSFAKLARRALQTETPVMVQVCWDLLFYLWILNGWNVWFWWSVRCSWNRIMVFSYIFGGVCRSRNWCAEPKMPSHLRRSECFFFLYRFYWSFRLLLLLMIWEIGMRRTSSSCLWSVGFCWKFVGH